MSKLMVLTKTPNPSRKKKLTLMAPVVSSSVVAAPRRRPRRRNPRVRSIVGGSAQKANFLEAYARTLTDPFEYEGLKLGYNCMLPTMLLTAYRRSSITVNADGSFALFYTPDVSRMVSTNNSGLAGATWNYFPAANASAFAAHVKEARVISGGLRCFALFPETSAPGVLFSGTVPDLTVNDWSAFSPNTLAALPGSRLGIGSKGASVTTRPYDNGSYEFFISPITGYAVAGIPYMTTGYISGIGFPVGTVIYYESITNIEGIAITATNSIGDPSDEVPSTAASFFPTVEGLFSAVGSILTSPVTMTATLSGLSTIPGAIGTSARAARFALSAFGQGSNYNRSVLNNGRRTTRMASEVESSSGYYVL